MNPLLILAAILHETAVLCVRLAWMGRNSNRPVSTGETPLPTSSRES